MREASRCERRERLRSGKGGCLVMGDSEREREFWSGPSGWVVAMDQWEVV